MNAKWNSLETFTVESAAGGGRLFWNGRQCVKLRVAIKATDINNHPVALSKREVSTITLVNYHGGGQIKYRAPDYFGPVEPRDGWDWSRVKAGDFDYFPTATSRIQPADEEPLPRSGNTQYVEFFVRAASQEPLTLSLTVERDDGVRFDSRGSDLGNITLTPYRPTTYLASQYKFDIAHTVKESTWTLDYVPFVLNDNGVNIEFREFSVSPVGVSYHAGGDKVRVGMVSGYTAPGSVVIVYPMSMPGSPKQVSGVTPAKGQPGLVSFRDRGISPAKIKNATVKAVDMYGNNHEVSVRIVDPERVDGRLELY